MPDTPNRASNEMIERKTYFIASKTRMLSVDNNKKQAKDSYGMFE